MKKISGHRIGTTLFGYILKELLLYCFVAFLFFFVIFFVNNLLVTIQDNLIKNVSLPLIMKFFLYSVPIVVANAAPYSAFIGALMCLGRFVGDSEFIALNALGVSDKKMLFPVMTAALILGLLNFALNDFLIPYTAPKLNEVAEEMLRENPAMQIQSYAIKKSNNVIIASGKVEKNNIHDLVVIDMSAENGINFLSAKNTQSRIAKNANVLMALEPLEPQLLVVDKNDFRTFDYAYGEKLTYHFLRSELENNSFFSLGPGQLSSYDLAKKIKTMRETQETSKEYLNWYALEFHKKFAIPLGAIFFIFLAYWLSRNLKLYNQGVGFVIGLIISVGYWAILMFGQQLAVKKNFDGAVTAWLPNVLLLILGAALMQKKLRGSL